METMFGDATGLIFAIVKTYCSFLNYLSSTSLAISLKVNLKVKKKKKELCCYWEVSKFIRAALVANASKVVVGAF